MMIDDCDLNLKYLKSERKIYGIIQFAYLDGL
jgi:hypothetical protein